MPDERDVLKHGETKANFILDTANKKRNNGRRFEVGYVSSALRSGVGLPYPSPPRSTIHSFALSQLP
jgi:hypothetical protein